MLLSGDDGAGSLALENQKFKFGGFPPIHGNLLRSSLTLGNYTLALVVIAHGVFGTPPFNYGPVFPLAVDAED